MKHICKECKKRVPARYAEVHERWHKKRKEEKKNDTQHISKQGNQAS